MHPPISRRAWLAGTATAAVGLATARAAEQPAQDPFTYCLNLSTIREQKLPLPEKIDVVAKAGYQAVEPWLRDIDQYVKDGGSLKDLAKRIRDHGLVVPSAIGFPEWVVDDDAKRKKGLEEAKRGMDLVRQLGGRRLAAPPAGATSQADLNLFKAAQRYRALLELGDQVGVVPQVEVWGFSKTLGKLSETVLVAMEAGHPRACVLPDVYHLHKGGTDFTSLKLLGPATMHVFHMNDYPANPPRAEITDAHRVYPGDGVAPLKEMLRDLRAVGYKGVLSLELFNKDYWQQDALVVAKTGLEKMKAVVRASAG